LDVFSDEKKFGKTTGGDIVSNKKTYLYLKAFELATGDNLNQLTQLFSLKTNDAREKVEKVKSIYEHLNIQRVTESKIEYYYQRAKTCLDEINLGQEKKSELVKFAESLKKREM